MKERANSAEEDVVQNKFLPLERASLRGLSPLEL